MTGERAILSTWRAADCRKLYRHHLAARHRHKEIGTFDFADIMAKDLLHNQHSKTPSSERGLVLDDVSLRRDAEPRLPAAGVPRQSDATTISSITANETVLSWDQARQHIPCLHSRKEIRSDKEGGTRTSHSRRKVCQKKPPIAVIFVAEAKHFGFVTRLTVVKSI